MAYPDLPKNRMIVDGIDITAKWGLILVDGYTLEPPEPKTYTVDIPGGDGVLDLTETLLGDTAYNNRKMEFEFHVIDCDFFEDVKSQVSDFLHGRSYDFQITMDPDYTYHGRFSVSGYSHQAYAIGIDGIIKIKIDANPFKYLKDRVYAINAVGGTLCYFESGRKRVAPTIETDGFLKVIYNNKLTTLPQGTWTINDVLFTYGTNEIYFNSYDIKNLTWGDLKTNGVTFAGFKQKRLFEWYKSKGDGTYVMDVWKDEEEKTWGDLSTKTWGSLQYLSEVTQDVKDIYVKYKVGDL